MHSAHEDTQASLIDMVARDPDVVSCLHRIYNTVLLNDIEILEGAAPATPALLATVNREYKSFFRDAVVLSYACGFVPFYLVTRRGVRYPRCLPLGSFSWKVRTNRGPGRAVAEYEVSVRSGSVKESAVHIFETETPVLMSNDYDLCSPLMGVHSEYARWKHAEAQVHHSTEWNRSKHVAVTERIDVKDQTTSGIQLLDEQRRYNLTGQHNNVVHNNLLRLTGATVTTNTSAAYQHAVHSQFADAETRTGGPAVGSKRAIVHLMPPNTELQELAPMDVGTAAADAKKDFQQAVYVFFGLPNIHHQQATTVRGVPDIHREQYSNILYMQSVLERLGETAYALCFGAEKTAVCFRMRAQPRFEIACVEDIKVLWEIQMLTPADLAHLRRTILNR